MRAPRIMRHAGIQPGRPSGFTAIELLVAVSIVLILVAVALASYQEHMVRKTRAQARSALLEAAAALRLQHARTGSYAIAALPVAQVPLDGDAVYRIGLAKSPLTADDPKAAFPASSGQAFTLKAEPVESDGCGTLLLDQAGRFGVVGGKLAGCWGKN